MNFVNILSEILFQNFQASGGIKTPASGGITAENWSFYSAINSDVFSA